jgi:hypothetical protein
MTAYIKHDTKMEAIPNITPRSTFIDCGLFSLLSVLLAARVNSKRLNNFSIGAAIKGEIKVSGAIKKAVNTLAK